MSSLAPPPWAQDPRPFRSLRDNEPVWSTRRPTEPRCWKCGAVTRQRWRLKRVEFWCAGCGGKIRGMGRTDAAARADAERRARHAVAQRDR